MRKVLLALALALVAGGVFVVKYDASADSIPMVVDTQAGSGVSRQTMLVFNDSGQTINSGEIVSWDRADSDLAANLRPYVTVPTAADEPYTAGVMLGTCADQTQCEIVVKGLALVRCADGQDNVTVGTAVGTASASAGGPFWLCGDYAYLADNAYLGIALGSGDGSDYQYIPVYVNPGWGDT